MLTTLLVTVLTAAGYAYEIDRVCQGAERTYRIDGEVGSTWAWTLVDQTGATIDNTIDNTYYSFKDFSDFDTDGNPIQGSEITVAWDLPAGTYTLSAEQTSTHGCENYELGTIEVLPNPVINAGPDLVACAAQPVDIEGATASHYDSLAWTTLGDGTFTSIVDLITTYTPGANDISADSAILVLTAFGLGNNGTCEVASDTLVVRISNLQLSVNHTDVLCYGANNGTITANAQGGYGTYTYRWQGPDGYTSVGDIILNLKPGTYDLEVTDEAGCKATTSVTLTEPNPIQLSASIIDAFCGGKTPGSIDLTVTGGTPNDTAPFYTYEWTDSLLFTATTEDITNLVGDRFYYVKVTDALGCSDTLHLFVNEERNIEITYTADSINCFGGNEGAIDIDVKFGKQPYEYEWQHGPTTQDLTGLAAGTYWLIVRDDRGCTADTIITLGQPEELLAQVTPDPAESCLGDTIQLTATATGGSGSYTHLWEGNGAVYLSSTTIPDPEFRGAPAGSYQLVYIAKDSLMCEARDTIEVNIKDNVQPLFANINDICQFSTPQSLPGISENGIDGTWLPDTISTDVAGTFEFVFTPDPSHECAIPETIQVTITPQIVPEFAPIADLCQNSIAPALPDLDLNGIAGTWLPDTIMTDVAGTFEFVFTPADTHECAEKDTIYITVTPQAIPDFAAIGPFCENDTPPALATTSPNGISGTWTPSAINTEAAGIFMFVFEPDGTVECSINDTIYVIVTKTLIPRLADIGPLCQGSMSPVWPDTDLDGIAGTWSADTINTQVPGTYTYTFTPANTYECAQPEDILVTILDLVDP